MANSDLGKLFTPEAESIFNEDQSKITKEVKKDLLQMILKRCKKGILGYRDGDELQSIIANIKFVGNEITLNKGDKVRSSDLSGDINITRYDIISINCFILFSALNYCDSMHDFMNTKREGTQSTKRETRHYYIFSSAAFFVMIQRIDWYIKKRFQDRLEFEPYNDDPFVDYKEDKDYQRVPNPNPSGPNRDLRLV